MYYNVSARDNSTSAPGCHFGAEMARPNLSRLARYAHSTPDMFYCNISGKPIPVGSPGGASRAIIPDRRANSHGQFESGISGRLVEVVGVEVAIW